MSREFKLKAEDGYLSLADKSAEFCQFVGPFDTVDLWVNLTADECCKGHYYCIYGEYYEKNIEVPPA